MFVDGNNVCKYPHSIYAMYFCQVNLKHEALLLK